MLNTPPKNLEDLNQLFLNISLQPSEYRLGEKTIAALRGLLAQPKKAAHSTITELAEQLGVSPATLTRLARRLAFGSFNQFQELFKDSLSTINTTFYSTQAARLIQLDQHLNKAQSATSLANQRMQQLANENIQNVHHFLQSLDNHTFLQAAKDIAAAPRVRIHGKRQYSSLAQFLTYGLKLIRSNISLLDPSNLGIAESLAKLETNDVLITASVNPYTQEVLNVSRQAAKMGITLITLTDTKESPLAHLATHTFLIPFQSSFYSNSISAYFVFAEGLLNQVAWELGERAVQSIKQIEEYIEALKVETY